MKSKKKSLFVELVKSRLSKKGFRVNIVETRGPGDATRIAEDAVKRGDYGVLACGGDGTVNEVAKALCNSDTALGILPAGSGNGLARHIGIPIDVVQSLSVIESNIIEPCDYGEVNGKPFFCTFGVGFDAAVSNRFALSNRRGLASYLTSAIDEFVKYNPDSYEIIADDRSITDKAFLVVVCNASQYGNNAFIAPTASIRDGLLDVTIVHKGNLFTHAFSGLEMIVGSIGNHGKISTFRTSSLTIRRANKTITHIDGDPTDLPEELNIRCHHKALKIFITTNKPQFHPFISPLGMMFKDWGIAISRTFRNKPQ